MKEEHWTNRKHWNHNLKKICQENENKWKGKISFNKFIFVVLLFASNSNRRGETICTSLHNSRGTCDPPLRSPDIACTLPRSYLRKNNKGFESTYEELLSIAQNQLQDDKRISKGNNMVQPVIEWSYSAWNFTWIENFAPIIFKNMSPYKVGHFVWYVLKNTDKSWKVMSWTFWMNCKNLLILVILLSPEERK